MTLNMTTTAPVRTLSELLDEYVTLRDTVTSLTAQKDELAAQLKAALQGGQEVTCDLYRAELRHSYTSEISVPDYRQMFGDTATLEVAQVNVKAVERLVKNGAIDPELVQAITRRRQRSLSLHLVALECVAAPNSIQEVAGWD